jgi:hypothetical protein
MTRNATDPILDAVACIEAALRFDRYAEAAIVAVADPQRVIPILARFVALLFTEQYEDPLERLATSRAELLAQLAEL